ncbi:Selenide, water dikinase [invertebrate metagenome]|uniref:Selenide, water dikinase n=1 Tax=invertebrate metagenome TaxID=1711999 RepID=A0A2H9T7Z4_9ZZZZ
MLEGLSDTQKYDALLVGNDTSDDGAVYDMGNGESVISSTDFFMPIVDDPYDFGRVAAANAISDIYAMGGTPMMALAILGWPVNVLPVDAAREVLRGGRDTCREAGMPMAGGHSIDTVEPIFGLAVNGRIATDRVKRNAGGHAGDRLYLTKPLGSGILTSAMKKGICTPEDEREAIEVMCSLNKAGAIFSVMKGVHGITDVTGFGLLGHLFEMCQGAGVGAVIERDEVPVLDSARRYLEQGCIPGGSQRNFECYGEHLGNVTEDDRRLFLDSQTSGGLLIAVNPEAEQEFLTVARQSRLKLSYCGYLTETGQDKTIKII